MGRHEDAGSRAVLALTAALATVRLVVIHGWIGEVVFLVAPFVALSAMWIASRRHEEDDPTAWGVLALGMGFLFAAEAYWSWLEFSDPTRFPSVADYLSVAGLVLIVLGLWKTATRVSPVGDRTGFIDATVLALAAGVLTWLLLVQPTASSQGPGGTEAFFTVSPLGLDIAMLAMAARLAFALKVRPRAYMFIYLAVAGGMLVDVVDSLLELGLHSEVGRIEDPIFILAYGCWAAAALSRRPVPQAATRTMRYLGGRRSILLLVCFSAPICALIAQELRGQALDTTSLIVVATVATSIGVLISIRFAGLISAVRDLATAKENERFAVMVENASDVIILVDLDLMITYASPSSASAWGRDPRSLVGTPFPDIVDGSESAVVATQLAQAATLPPGSIVTIQTRIERSGGGYRICEAVAANLHHHGVEGISITLRDVTDQRALEDELRDSAFNDALTGLANRALFMNRVEHALAGRRDLDDDGIAVLYIDLDDFKQVNDGLGHSAGDELLIAVGQRIKECVRPGDTLARLGGDEFAILLEGRSGVVDAISAALRIQEVLAMPLPAGDLHLGVRASIGIALARLGSTPQDLLRDADIAMYEAKGSGEGYVLFDPTMRVAAANRISLRSDLQGALARGEMHLVYQPIFDLKTQLITSAEALLRWEHPTRGSVSPVEFIPIAEQGVQIRDIGQWVLGQACRDAARWVNGSHAISVSVNASAVQFQDRTFEDQVRGALDGSGLAPERLTIEVTETAMMNDPDVTSRVLAGLRSIGVKVSIDDFGTGYCSLAYLKRFPVDVLKLDRSFVSEITADSDNLLAHNILRLADSLSIPVVAEGIEDVAQLDNLTRHGCAFGQGFHLARPMVAETFDRFIGDRPGALHEAAGT